MDIEQQKEQEYKRISSWISGEDVSTEFKFTPYHYFRMNKEGVIETTSDLKFTQDEIINIIRAIERNVQKEPLDVFGFYVEWEFDQLRGTEDILINGFRYPKSQIINIRHSIYQNQVRGFGASVFGAPKNND